METGSFEKTETPAGLAGGDADQPGDEPPVQIPRAPDEDAYVIPCPFSHHYRVPVTQAWRSLALFIMYRCVLGCAFVLPLWLGRLNSFVNVQDPHRFVAYSGVYLITALLGLPLYLARRPQLGSQVHLHVLSDILLIAVLMSASGGVAGGLGMLMACSVAAGGILAGGRCALGFAAIASIAVLLQELAVGFGQFPSAMSSTSAGLLGAAFFAVAMLANALSRRAEQSQRLAAQHGHDLETLRQLNAFIVDHLQAGVIVLDDAHRIRTANPAAKRLLGADAKVGTIEELSPAFRQAYFAWTRQQSEVSGTLSSPAGQPVHVRFARVLRSDPPLSMVMLEDEAVHKQRVQQSKLSSLGRLTGSIAHEVRNPLSAIHQAAQLLSESAALSAEDQRLLDIILRHARRVNEIIENVMQLSRGRSTQRERVELRPWVERFLADFAEERGLSTAPFTLRGSERPLYALVDPSHLRQILDNVCSNAMKYGKPDKGSLEIRLEPAAQEGRPCIAVVDHGGGIDGATADQIFEPFFTTSRSGTGLGLYVARELAELNQARIDYRPLGDGSEFRICLADGRHTAI